MHFLCLAAWSINEQMAGRPGLALAPPTLEWTGELLALAAADAREKRPPSSEFE